MESSVILIWRYFVGKDNSAGITSPFPTLNRFKQLKGGILKCFKMLQNLSREIWEALKAFSQTPLICLKPVTIFTIKV